MLYQTISQPTIWLLFSIFGFVSGFLIDILKIINIFFKKIKLLNNFFSFIIYFSIFFIYFFVNLKFNYGELRFYTFIVFSFSFFAQRALIQNFVAKPVSKWYNMKKERRNEGKEVVVEKSKHI